MKKIFFWGALLMGAVAYGQNRVDVTADRGDDLNQYILDSVKYVNEDFKPGVVTFRDGSVSRGAVNITTLEQAVLFISPEGEIQQLANIKEVARVSIGKRMFFRHNEAFVELMELVGDVGIGAVHRTSILDAQAKGAFGMVSETTAISSMTTLSDNGQLYSLAKNLNVPVLYKKVPYIYRNESFSVASKKSFIKAFPSKKGAIEAYLKEHKVDFDEYDDVKALFDAVK